MNELERLIAGLPVPSPSAELDGRIAELTAARPGAGPAVRARTRRRAMVVACTACAGIAGFILGRHSVPPPATTRPLAGKSTVPAVHEPLPRGRIATSAARAIEPLAEHSSLLNFVTLPRRTEKLFGEGPLTERLHSPVLE